MLEVEYGAQFKRDYKRCKRRHLPLHELHGVIRLIAADTDEARDELCRRHNMHALQGEWKGRHECHVANIGDWLVVWSSNGTTAFFERTGTHDELFR